MSRLLLIWVIALAGCVTESTGGPPEPASVKERVRAQLDLARGYLEKRDWNRARVPLTRALEIDPQSVEAHVLTAFLYESEGENDLAETHYKRALAIDSSDAQALNNYGSFLYKQQRYDDALVPLRKLVTDTEYDGRAQAFENLGIAELRAGNSERARAAFERSLSLESDQPRSSLELASMAFEEGSFDAADRHLNQYLKFARQTPRSLCLGIKLATADGDADRVASNEIALKNLYPRSREARQCLTATP